MLNIKYNRVIFTFTFLVLKTERRKNCFHSLIFCLLTFAGDLLLTELWHFSSSSTTQTSFKLIMLKVKYKRWIFTFTSLVLKTECGKNRLAFPEVVDTLKYPDPPDIFNTLMLSGWLNRVAVVLLISLGLDSCSSRFAEHR